MAEDIDANSNSNSPCQSKADCCSSDAANEEDIATSNSPLSTTPPSIGKSIKPSTKSVTSTASTVNKNRTNAAMDLTELDAASSAEISEILNHLFSGHELNKSIPPPPPLSAEAKEACHRMAASSSPTNQSLYSMIVKNKLIAEDDVLAIDDDTPTTSKKAAAIAAARKATTATATATADVNNNTNVIDNSKLGAVNANHSPPVDGANFYANDIEIDDDDEDDDDHDQNEGFLDRLKKKPTPLYLHNVPEIMPVLLDINKVIGENNYYTKPTAGHGLRIQCANIAVYRQLAHHFKQNNIESHTYQLQADRGFRFMIRHLHHSTPDAWIRQQLTNLGHKVRYVSVIKKRFTRQPLNMFEVEIAAESSSLNVLDITCLGGQKVQVEKILRNVDAVQCHRCQKFGHTKNYCRRPFVCVKCSGSHPSTECERKKGASSQPPPKCANCQGEHAASYRGCKSYKDACRLKSSAAKGHQLASKMVADLARNRSDNAASMAMTIKQHLYNANAVKQPQMPLQQQQQQQQRKQPQMPRQQQQPIKVNKLSKQQLPQQPLKNIKPYPKKQSQSTLLSYADALKANHHPVQLNQPIARQQPQPQEALRQKLPYDDVSTDAATNFKYESRQRGDVNTSTDQKLDILISLMLEERKRPAAPVVNSNNSSSNLEEKIDKLINMIGLLATHLMKDNRI